MAVAVITNPVNLSTSQGTKQEDSPISLLILHLGARVAGAEPKAEEVVFIMSPSTGADNVSGAII